jgi:hypothetical protein
MDRIERVGPADGGPAPLPTVAPVRRPSRREQEDEARERRRDRERVEREAREAGRRRPEDDGLPHVDVSA